ncbi:hypothetical protein LEP1GSC108_0974 [Leptospira weilii str. UI 13098]|uniref:Uncharacterized protein n=1 Tax=Leptospira weilii str. UI 13098 TaxID=1088542 RepID=M6Q1K4_9LEPT|nr:hypothetical protein LEP1GSC108_0974 [Leptospira weilii str. UI 13098]
MFEIDSEFTLEQDIKSRVYHPIEIAGVPTIGKSLFVKSMALVFVSENSFYRFFFTRRGTQTMTHPLRGLQIGSMRRSWYCDLKSCQGSFESLRRSKQT